MTRIISLIRLLRLSRIIKLYKLTRELMRHRLEKQDEEKKLKRFSTKIMAFHRQNNAKKRE